MPRVLNANDAELWLICAGFEDLNLTGDSIIDGNQFELMAMASEQVTWGTPSPIDVQVQRWMTDGAVASTQGHDDRTLQFTVRARANTSRDLAAAEAALALRSARPCLLKWVPLEGAPDAPATVFEVWTWHLAHAMDFTDEADLTRMYAVEATAMPWARSADLTTAAALSTGGASPTIVSIDTCTVTTGWAGIPNTPTATGGAVFESGSATVGSVVGRTLTRTGSVTGLAALPYLMITYSTSGAAANNSSTTVKIDGLALTKVAQVSGVGYWQIPAGVTSFTTLSIISLLTATATTVVLSVADVSKTDTVAGIGSHRQFVRHLDVGGSVKTSGSIQIASPSATALGNVLVYTCPDDESGYSPPLRQYRTSGNTVTPDATCVSGNHESLVSGGASVGTITYTIPAGRLREATYALVGRFQFGSAAVMSLNVRANVTGFSQQLMTGKVTSLVIGGNVWGVIGTLTLPPSALPAASMLSTVLTVSAGADNGTHNLDELYLFDVTHGSNPTLVTGSLPAFTRLWIDAPDADPVRNRPAVYVGTAADRSDAAAPTPGLLAAAVASHGDHDLDPRGALLFTVTDNVNDAVATGSFYRRWHTHAGD